MPPKTLTNSNVRNVLRKSFEHSLAPQLIKELAGFKKVKGLVEYNNMIQLLGYDSDKPSSRVVIKLHISVEKLEK